MSAKKPLFAFFGTPRFAVRVLDALEGRGLLPAIIITAPDKPQGRGLELAPSPAKEWALERGIDVLTPQTLKDESFVAELGNTEWEVFAVAAYNKLIPKRILDMPQHGSLNVHPSLLPKFRGPSPALSAILADQRATGVSIMQMDEQMDHGPTVAQASVELEEEAWPPRGSLFEDLLATEGGNLLAETIPFWISGKLTPEPQDESAVTFTKKFTTEDALIELDGDARKNFLKIRAFDKSPRAHFFAEKSGPSTGSLGHSTATGEAGQAKRIRVIIANADMQGGVLHITRVIPEGKKEMAYDDFLRGLQS